MYVRIPSSILTHWGKPSSNTGIQAYLNKYTQQTGRFKPQWFQIILNQVYLYPLQRMSCKLWEFARLCLSYNHEAKWQFSIVEACLFVGGLLDIAKPTIPLLSIKTSSSEEHKTSKLFLDSTTLVLKANHCSDLILCINQKAIMLQPKANVQFHGNCFMVVN